jgi:hypothetical protein
MENNERDEKTLTPIFDTAIMLQASEDIKKAEKNILNALRNLSIQLSRQQHFAILVFKHTGAGPRELERYHREVEEKFPYESVETV